MRAPQQGRLVCAARARGSKRRKSRRLDESVHFFESLTDQPGRHLPPTTATFAVMALRGRENARVKRVQDFFRLAYDKGPQDATCSWLVPLPPALVKQITDYWKNTPSRQLAEALRPACNSGGTFKHTSEIEVEDAHEYRIFKGVLVPVTRRSGLFMLGLEFMSNGSRRLSVNKMRAFMAKTAGTPIKGDCGTLITGVIQSSNCHDGDGVGLVSRRRRALRPAISLIMGAILAPTIGNG